MIDRNPSDAPAPGPITPPSLGEIYQISARRQRTRYRLIQGTLAAVAVAGVGIGIRGRAPVTETAEQPTIESVPAEEQSGLPTGDTDTTTSALDTATDSSLGGAVEDQIVDWSNVDSCFFDPGSQGVAPWMADGQAFFSTLEPGNDIAALSAAWQIPFEEVEAIAGLAAQTNVTLQPETIDEAFFQWSEDGYTGEQLGELAAIWNVSSISIKVLQFLGDPAIHAALVECGLVEAES
jgi:hypothetical protein